MTITFFVQGKPRPGGSKTAMPIYGAGGHAVTRPTATGKHRPVLRYVDDAKGNGEWRKLVASAARAEMQKRGLAMTSDALRVHFMFYFARPKFHAGKRGLLPSAPLHHTVKPDVLKLARATEDALTGIVWRDDAANVAITISKAYADTTPEGCAISITLHHSNL